MIIEQYVVGTDGKPLPNGEVPIPQRRVKLDMSRTTAIETLRSLERMLALVDEFSDTEIMFAAGLADDDQHAYDEIGGIVKQLTEVLNATPGDKS